MKRINFVLIVLYSMKIHAFQAHRKETDIKATFLVVLKREESLPRKKKEKRKKKVCQEKKKRKEKEKKRTKKNEKSKSQSALNPL